MVTITSTARTDAFNVDGGDLYLSLKGTWDGASISIYYTPLDDPAESDWDLQDQNDVTEFTEDKSFLARLPRGKVSFKASSVGGSTSVVAKVIDLETTDEH